MLNAALMRRFVRYHKLAVTFGDDELDLGVRMIANKLHGSSTDENVIAVTQALTRLEDAELALLHDDPTGEAPGCRDVARKLFALADVDPVKWREVTP